MIISYKTWTSQVSFFPPFFLPFNHRFVRLEILCTNFLHRCRQCYRLLVRWYLFSDTEWFSDRVDDANLSHIARARLNNSVDDCLTQFSSNNLSMRAFLLFTNFDLNYATDILSWHFWLLGRCFFVFLLINILYANAHFKHESWILFSDDKKMSSRDYISGTSFFFIYFSITHKNQIKIVQYFL